MKYLNEARGVATIGKITFTYNGEKLKFPIGAEKSSFRNCYLQIYNWLFDKKYDFKNVKNVFNNNGNFYSKEEVDEIIKSGRYQRRLFQKLLNSDKYLLVAGNKSQYKENLINMLDDFEAEDIKFEGFDSENKIIKFVDVDDIEVDDIEVDELEDPIETEIENTKSINKIKIFEKNPFRQSLCVVGEPGAGKSQTMLNILQEEGHKTLLFIPTELSTSMVVQYSEGKLRLNRLGNFIVKAYEYPDTLFTVLIDEFHKPMTIKRVNDELLQAISTSRYSGNRFLTLEVAEELMEEKLKSLGISEEEYLYHSNIRIPNNLGFVLLTSKPSVIVDNKDIYDRVNITEIKKEYYDESTGESMIKKLSDLDNIILKTKQEKDQFKEELKSRDI